MRDLIGRFLAVFLIAGLVAAPLVSPAAAKPVSASQMSVADMSEGMTCCPDEPQKGSCPDCPLVAMCILKLTLDGPSSAAAMLPRLPAKMVHGLRNDEPSRDLGRPPPDHPPRSQI